MIWILWTGLMMPLGCNSGLFGKDDTASDTAVEPSAPTRAPIADVNWGSSSLELIIEHGAGYDFFFGIVETTDECKSSSQGCWTGENCGTDEGYASSDGSILWGPYCHQAGEVGLSLSYSSSIGDVINGDSFVAEGQTTAFPAPTDDSTYEYSVSYFLEDRISGKCWVWGVDVNYFAARECSYPVPFSTSSASNIRHSFELHHAE